MEYLKDCGWQLKGFRVAIRGVEADMILFPKPIL
jgi:hypothetical protein